VGKYGVDTSVSVERSITEIQSTLQRSAIEASYAHGKMLPLLPGVKGSNGQ